MDATSASDMLTVVQYVDHFYATSWSHLILIVSLAFGVVGVAMPILIQVFREWAMRHDSKVIRSAIMGEVSVLLEDKIKTATKLLEERSARDRAEFEEEVRKEIAGAIARDYHIQTKVLINEEAYKAAFRSGMHGLRSYIDSEDHLRLRRMLHLMSHKCLPMMTKTQLNEMQEEKEAFHEVVLRIMKWDVKGDFTDKVDEAKRAFKAASERVPGVKTEGS